LGWSASSPPPLSCPQFPLRVFLRTLPILHSCRRARRSHRLRLLLPRQPPAHPLAQPVRNRPKPALHPAGQPLQPLPAPEPGVQAAAACLMGALGQCWLPGGALRPRCRPAPASALAGHASAGGGAGIGVGAGAGSACRAACSSCALPGGRHAGGGAGCWWRRLLHCPAAPAVWAAAWAVAVGCVPAAGTLFLAPGLGGASAAVALACTARLAPCCSSRPGLGCRLLHWPAGRCVPCAHHPWQPISRLLLQPAAAGGLLLPTLLCCLQALLLLLWLPLLLWRLTNRAVGACGRRHRALVNLQQACCAASCLVAAYGAGWRQEPSADC
jgi:hypothetical protein